MEILLVASLCKSGRAERVFKKNICFHSRSKKLLGIYVPAGDGLWGCQRWSLIGSLIVSDGVRDSLWRGLRCVPVGSKISSWLRYKGTKFLRYCQIIKHLFSTIWVKYCKLFVNTQERTFEGGSDCHPAIHCHWASDEFSVIFYLFFGYPREDTKPLVISKLTYNFYFLPYFC